MPRILKLENAIDELERELQERHIVRLNNNECNAQAGAMFIDLIGNLERVSDHATNVAFALLEHDPEEDKQPKIRG
jgi:phosphate:Na+ symporter